MKYLKENNIDVKPFLFDNHGPKRKSTQLTSFEEGIATSSSLSKKDDHSKGECF